MPNGTITVRDVVGARCAEEHTIRVNEWARNVWSAWSPHHLTVRGWLEESGIALR